MNKIIYIILIINIIINIIVSIIGLVIYKDIKCNSRPSKIKRIYTNISAGCDHSLALTDDGQIFGWGNNENDQINISSSDLPSGSTKWIAISAGNFYSLGLSDNGQIIGWGINISGQLNIPSLPSGATKWIAISTGMFHSLGLTDDGQIIQWGDINAINMQGNTDLEKTKIPSLPSGATKWVAIKACYICSLGLTDDGQIKGWGSNSYKQITIPFLFGGEKWVSMSGNMYHVLGLTNNGTLLCWGNQSTNVIPAPNLQSGEKWVSFSAGFNYSVGSTNYGRLIEWGFDNIIRNTTSSFMYGSPNWIGTSAGFFNSFGLLDNRIFGWDINSSNIAFPSLPAGRKWIAISTLYSHVLVLTDDGQIKGWGSNYFKQIPQ